MNFEMIGKISMSKDSEKFHPWSETKYDSGWVRRTLMFNAVCGDNRHMLTINGGSYADEHGDIHTFSKATVDANGNRQKGEKIVIPFKDRFTSDKLAEVAEFKKFIVDLEKPGRRYKLENAFEKVKDGATLAEDELKELNLTEESELADAVEKSRKKRHEFISEWDFAEFVKKVIDSGKYADKKFKITGNGEYAYSENKERVYENYAPTRLYLADDTAEATSTATLTLLYDENSLDEMSVEDKGKYYVNGWMMEYDSNRKGNIPVPTTVAIVVDNSDEKATRKTEVIRKKFEVSGDEIREYGVVVNMLNGAQRVEITEEMLTDEQREDLDLGIITMDDIRAELGNGVFGDKIREYQFVKPARGFTKGAQETTYTVDDMVITSIDDEDLFDDDDI